MSPMEKLRDAVQEYHRAATTDPGVVTDYVVAYATVDMHTASEQNYVASVASGSAHAALGLAHILVRDLEEATERGSS